MLSYQDWTLKTKLASIAVLTCITATGLACAALFIYEVYAFKQSVFADLKGQAKVIGGLSTAALSFDDTATATELLGELKNQKHIRWAVIFKNGKTFAQYRAADSQATLPSVPPTQIGEQFTADGLRLHTDISLKTERIGTIYISADFSQLRARLREYGEILMVVFIASSALALIMSSRLQRSIVVPVQRLADSARIIAEQKDYSVRVPTYGQDELGRLTGAFNTMLSRIQVQDSELREGRERFEVAVAGARDGIWDWNIATNDLYLSPQTKAMLGFQPDELENSMESWTNLSHPDDRERTIQTMMEYLEGKRPVYEVEHRMRNKAGEYRWILTRGAALRDGDGKPHRMAGSITDITDRKNAEDQLTRVQRDLLEASRLAGMAEVATGVLHNVGNVLNSVNVSASVVLDQLKKSRSSHLGKTVELLKEHQAHLGEFLNQDAKGKRVLPFLEMLSNHLGEEQAQLIKETEGLQQNIEHIKHIVAMQQTYAKVSGVMENLVPQELMEDALRMSSAGLERHRIELSRQYQSVGTVMVDRHKVLQILVNLISNAKHALDQRADGRRLTLRILETSPHSVRMEVADNGTGIAPENLTRIFQHGFTTKKSGHGFGLHSGANAAKEMGGALSVRSDGPGLGATFTLELPRAKAIASISESSRMNEPAPPQTKAP